MPYFLYLPFIADSMTQMGWKIQKKAVLNAKRMHIIHTALHIIVQTRPRYVSVQKKYFLNILYALFQNHMKTGVQCTHPKSRCPVYSNSFTPKLKNAVRYILEIHKYTLNNIYDQFSWKCRHLNIKQRQNLRKVLANRRSVQRTKILTTLARFQA